MTEYKEQQLRQFLATLEAGLRELMMDSHERGTHWQDEFKAIVAAHGFHVESPKNGAREDVVVNGLKVQCKNIDQIDENGFVSIDNMRPVKANGGERGYLCGEYDVLALKTCGIRYFIPAFDLRDDESTKMRARIRPAAYTRYRDAIKVFANDFIPPPPPTSLFDRSEAII